MAEINEKELGKVTGGARLEPEHELKHKLFGDCPNGYTEVSNGTCTGCQYVIKKNDEGTCSKGAMGIFLFPHEVYAAPQY